MSLNLSTEDILFLFANGALPAITDLVSSTPENGVASYPLVPRDGVCPGCGESPEFLFSNGLRVAFCPACRTQWLAGINALLASPAIERYRMVRGLFPPESVN